MAFAVIRMFGYDSNNYLDYPLMLIVGYKGVSLILKGSNNQVFKLFTAFFVYCAFSGFFYLLNGVPFRCYFISAQLLLLPMIFFYYGCKFNPSNDEFEKMFIYGCTFCFLVGFYLYIARPSFYVAAVERATANLSDSDLAGRDLVDYVRFGSFFGNSYPVEFFSVPTLILSLYYLNKKYIKKIVLYIAAISAFVAAFICIQRASVAGAMGVLIFYFFYKGKGGKMKITLILSAFVIFAFVIFADIISSTDSYENLNLQFNDMLSRFDFSQAMDERKYQYKEFNRSSFVSDIVGLGLGTCGHQARYFGLQTINDNQYMLLFREFGLIGCLLLLIVIVRSIVRGLKNFKIYYPQLLILGFFLFAFLGSEPLEVAYVSCVFWFSLGRIWNSDYYIRRKQELSNGK